MLAVALDLLLGDPPNRYHPVTWIGRLIALGWRRASRPSIAGWVLSPLTPRYQMLGPRARDPQHHAPR
jgi:cobalamin biosynthesis protein CobD/CbiB